MEIRHKTMQWGDTDSYSIIAWNNFNDKNYHAKFTLGHDENIQTYIDLHLIKALIAFEKYEIEKNLKRWLFDGGEIEVFVKKLEEESPNYQVIYNEKDGHIYHQKNVHLKPIEVMKLVNIIHIGEQ